jgi:hypothetical protein
MKKFIKMNQFGQLQMDRFKITKEDISIYQLKNGKTKCIGGIVLLKVTLIVNIFIGDVKINT